MPYIIPFSDPNKISDAITVNDLTENNTSTSLSLVGRNYSNYGVAIAKNFVHLLENFANATPPNNGIEGQLWYNNQTKRLFINDSTGGTRNWRPAGGTYVSSSASQISNPILGDLWVNSLTQQLSLYNGSDWVLVGPTSLSGRKSGVYVEQIEDSSGISHFITVEYNNDSAIKITATESFFPQREIDGFTVINPGINLSNKKFIGSGDGSTANTPAKIYGTITNAEALKVNTPQIENVPADNFARRDVSNVFFGQQSILNDAGLNIGSSGNFSLTVSTGTSVIKNSFDGGSIDFIVNKQGAQNVILKIDGQNRRVGINHPLPNAELDVNGDAFISGHLITTGILDSSSPNTGSLQIRGGAGIAKNLNVGKNIVSKGHIQVGEINDSGINVAGPAIIPSANLLYDIGTPNNKFKTVYAERFDGSFSGAFSGTVTGDVIGEASALKSTTTVSITGDAVTTSSVSFKGDGVPLTLNTSISSQAITGKTEVVDNRVDDTLLIHRANVGLRRVTRTNFLLGEAFVPIGSIFPYAGSSAPAGYLFCDGALVSRVEYPTLFQVIGSLYGSAAGGAYFRLPDLRGRFPLGSAGMANPLGNLILNKTISITANSNTDIVVNNVDDILVGMVLTSNSSGANIPSNTFVSEILGSNSIRLSNPVTISTPSTLIFTLRVLKDPVSSNSVDRVSNVPGNNSASTVGADGGFVQKTVNLTTQGTSGISFSTGAGQTLNTVQELNVVNPYLTINYIIRAGVGSFQSN